jgi:hypothetical protein
VIALMVADFEERIGRLRYPRQPLPRYQAMTVPGHSRAGPIAAEAAD